MRLPFFIFAAGSLLLIGCAATGPGQKKSSDTTDTCRALVVEDAIIPDSLKPIETAKIRKAGFNTCYTAYGVRLAAQKLACEKGYPFAHIYNFEKPGVFGAMMSGPCAMADVDFYAPIPPYKPSPVPIVTYDTLPNNGLELFATFSVGNAVGGAQRNPALSPKPSVEKINFGVNAEYFPNRLGVEADVDYFGRGTARKDHYPSMALYDAAVFRLGASATLWRKARLTNRLKLDASAGLNYTLLKLDDEYAGFLGDGVVTDWGGGFGYYGKLKLKGFLYNGIGGYLGFKYEFENPTLKDAREPLDAHTLQVLLGLGYKF